ncbi:digestive cysteine proteinase 2-like [Acanthaster planci]|uniref:Digestive cysteine proteinase 2-like n=1 Tax=Acanthaster planci TaxID=133434 RepID=A0A8B7Z0V0_ACAPL|nr:digestive cysteine proteinase 2-like [Acanthaster planci]
MLYQILFVFLAAAVLFDSNDAAAPKPPTFGSRYHAKGFVQLPYAELNEPFEIYFDGQKSMGRIDFYGGMDQAFYDGAKKPYGVAYEVYPTVKSKTSTTPETTCLTMTGKKGSLIMPQSMLPNLNGFKPNGQKLINGQMTDVWMMITNPKTAKVNTYMLYVSRGAKVRPVRYEMMGYDTLLGSHYDKYVIDYSMFDDTTAFQASVFTPPKVCNVTLPSGIENHIRVNPYQELFNPELGDRYQHMFKEYKVKHGKVYADEEHEKRKVQFMHNVRLIHGNNRQGLGFSLAVNHLADLFDDELRMMRGRRPSNRDDIGGAPFSTEDFKIKTPPPSLDWRLNGSVSQVKDQAICGSCWSFGAAEVIEGAYFKKNGKMVRFSQQNLMDCSWGFGNMGCNGGEEFQAYEWVLANKGLMTEEAYGPYLGQDGKCHFDASKAGVKLSNYTKVQSGNKTALTLALANVGPIAVGIDAHLKTFSFYASGVYYDKACGNKPGDLDHAVLAVGYGTMIVDKKSTPYWIIKNSWSTYWGNNGYVLMSQQDNNCGVATAATYVIL